VVYSPAVSVEQGGDTAIAISAILLGIANDGSGQPHLIIRLGGLVTLGPTRLLNHPADTAFRHRQSLPDMLDALPTGSGLEVSPYRLLEDQFVQSEIRHRPSQPSILLLQGLEPLSLFYL
jgi:hypothetical protein